MKNPACTVIIGQISESSYLQALATFEQNSDQVDYFLLVWQTAYFQ